MNAAGTWRARAVPATAIVAVLAALAPAAHSQAPAVTAVRSGNHGDYGRVVIDANGKTAFTVDQDGDHLIVHLTDVAWLGPAPPLPRNVVSIITDGSTLDLMLQHGAKAHAWPLAGRVVVDVSAANAPTGTLLTAPKPNQRPFVPLSMATSPELGGRRPDLVAAAPVPVQSQVLPPPPTAPAAPPAVAVEAIQQLPPGRDVLPENDGPVGLRARRARLPKEIDGSAFLVPFDAATGAASFHSGDSP